MGERSQREETRGRRPTGATRPAHAVALVALLVLAGAPLAAAAAERAHVAAADPGGWTGDGPQVWRGGESADAARREATSALEAFDGARLSLRSERGVVLSAVADLAPGSWAPGELVAARPVVGLGLELPEGALPGLEGRVSLMQEWTEGRADRRVLDGQVRLLGERWSLTGALDADVRAGLLEAADLSGTFAAAKDTTLRFTLGRQLPARSATGVDLLERGAAADVLARDPEGELAATGGHGSVGFRQRLGGLLALSGDVALAHLVTHTATDATSPPASALGIAPSLELEGSGLLREDDTCALGLDFVRSGGLDRTTLSLGSRLPLGGGAALAPRLVLDRHTGGGRDTTWGPAQALGLEWRMGAVALDAEARYEALLGGTARASGTDPAASLRLGLQYAF